MRHFVTLSHTARADGQWSLNDLAGGAGRIDVLCRNIQSALFLSHGLRADTNFYAVVAPPSSKGRTIRLEGGSIQMLHPDERSTAARLQQALKVDWIVPDWKEVQRGLRVAGYGLVELLDELGQQATPILLDPEGTPISNWTPPENPAFFLSDHVPFTQAEYDALEQAGAQRVSLGSHWYHGNHAIAVVQWFLDQRSPTPPGRAKS